MNANCVLLALILSSLTLSACQTLGVVRPAPEFVGATDIKESEFRLSWGASDLAAPTYVREVEESGIFAEIAKYSGDTESGRQASLRLKDMNGNGFIQDRRVDLVGLISRTENGGLPDARATGRRYYVRNEHGLVMGTPFRTNTNECVAFQQNLTQYHTTPRTVFGDSRIVGYYCARRGVALSKPDQQKLLKSIRFLGELAR